MPGNEDGISILKEIKSLYPSQLVIMLTAVGNIETAVKTIKLGAVDYIEKPFDINKIRNCLAKVEHTIELENEVKLLKDELEKFYPAKKIIGHSKSLKDIFEITEEIQEALDSKLILKYFSKPFNINEIEKTIKEAIG